MLAAALLAALTVLPGTPASADHFGGPVILHALDAENCGPGAPDGSGGHGPIGTWVTLVQKALLANTSNEGDGILIIGANPLDSNDTRAGPHAFWRAIGAGTGETITFGDENSSFAGYQMIAIVGAATFQCGGLRQAQNTVLTSRAAEFAAFVNGGGGLFASDQSSFPDGVEFGFVGGPNSFLMEKPRNGPFTTTYDNIDPTPEGLAVGVNDSLDIYSWHQIFSKFPDFLKPLAYRTRTLQVAVLGGPKVIFPVTPGGEFPTHPPPPPPPPPGLLDGVTGVVNTVTGLVNPGPSPTPSPAPSPSTADVGAAAPVAGSITPPRDGSTGPVPIGGVKAGGGGTASGSGARAAAIMLILLAAVAHFLVFVKRKTGAANRMGR